MSPIAVDIEVFSRAADRYQTAYSQAKTTGETLARTLDDNWGCAGTDPAAANWSGNYDPAAFAAIAGLTDLINANARLHDLLAATAVNHANAENAATSPPQPSAAQPPANGEFAAPRFRGAYGGHQPPPFGWSAITSIATQLVWPNGDPDRLRALAGAWRQAASELRSSTDSLGPTWGELEAQSSPEMPQVLAQLDIVFTFAEDLALRFDELAESCREWAWDIEQAHRDIENILAQAIAAAVIVGVITAVATAGFATAAVESGVAATTAISVGAVLVTLDGAAVAAASTAAGVGVAVVGAAKQIQPLLDARPTTFEAVATGRGRTLQYHPAPDELKGFPGTFEVKQLGRRKRWSDKKGKIYEWDFQHGRVEVYSKEGRHLGEFDAETGEQTGKAIRNRRTAR